MIDQRKFDELVDNTTRYLTDILKRLEAAENKLANLEKPKPSTVKKETK